MPVSITMRRLGVVPAFIASLFVALSFAVPAHAAAPALSLAVTNINGFDTSAQIITPGASISDRVTVSTGTLAAPKRIVQVQRRLAGVGGTWTVESTGRTNAAGAYVAVLKPPAAGDYEYRLRVSASATATFALSPVKRVLVVDEPPLP